MIKNNSKVEKFNRELIKKENISYKQALRIYDMLHAEAVSLGAINSKNIMDGIEVDIRIAKAINGLGRGRKTNKKNSSKVGRR